MTATISPRSGAQDVQYDAFLSYSHAADGQLAPALQNAVQRFATPWYRLRSLHLFRDQTGLSASPGLWAAIEAALSDATWFVLFASPDAAASVWVEREVSWWLAHRDHRHLLIVVTDGTFEWGAGGDSPARARGSAVPDALAEALPEEPRWIDLRWARSADHVDARDPRFREAAADLAATLRGMPKDSLIGDDIRQHRHGRRLAIGTIVVLTVLALVVVGLVVVATREQATTQGERTVRAASSMIVEADAVRSRDPRTALQLGVAAHRLDPTPQTEAALVESLTTPFLAELAGHKAPISDIAWAPNGTHFDTADDAGRVIIHELVGQDSARPIGLPIELGAPAEHLAFTSDGTRLAVTAAGRAELVELSGERRISSARLPGPTDLLASTPSGDPIIVVDEQLLRWDRSGEMTTETLAGAGNVDRAALSSDGRLLATASRSSGVVLWDVNGPPHRLGVVTPTASEGTLPVFAPRQPRLLVGSEDGTVAQSDITNPRAPGLLTPPTRVVERTLLELKVSNDGRAQAAASIDGSISLTTSSETLQLRAHRTAPLALAFSPDGTRLLSGALDGALILWDTGPGRGPVLATLDPVSHKGALLTMAVPRTKNGPLATGDNDGVLLWDVPEPGRLARRPGRISVPGAVLALALGDDDRMLAVGTTTGRVSIWDLTAPGGPRQRREIAVPGLHVYDLEYFPDGRTLVAAGDDVGVQLIDVATGAITALPHPGKPHTVLVTPDARRLLVSDNLTNTFVLWDVTDRQRPRVAANIASGHDTATVEAMAFARTATGTLLVSAGREGKLVLSAFDDPDHARELGEIDTARRVQTRADSAALLALTISPDGRTLAAAGEEGPIGLWDIADPSQPRQIGAPLRELQGQVYGVGLLPDGLTLVAGGQDEHIAAWDLRPIAELRRTAIATACRRTGAPLAAAEWDRLAPELKYRDTCTS